MVSSIAIGLGMSAITGDSDPQEMRGLNAFALRGIVAAAFSPASEPAEPVTDYRRELPPADRLEQTFPRPFIR